MDAQSRNLVVSGIEPVDKLLGGLGSGRLYMVHGEASGKSLFGIKFLIEGLKRNENVALVIRYSPEDAVRRFARLGYDCLEDVYSGRLVILEYSDDIVQKIGKLRALTPVLRELEWLLGETRPKRLVFDPVTSVLSGSEGDINSKTREFSEWARSFGATVVLTANEASREVIQAFESQVAESFRFDLREVNDRAARFLVFEKSPTLPDQAIEVDPSRGVFLLDRSLEDLGPHPPSIAELELIRDELRSARRLASAPPADSRWEVDLMSEDEGATGQRGLDTGELAANARPPVNRQTSKLTTREEQQTQSRVTPSSAESSQVVELELPFEGPSVIRPQGVPIGDTPLDELSDLLDDLTGTATPLDLEWPAPERARQPSAVNQGPGAPSTEPAAREEPRASSAPAGAPGGETEAPRTQKHSRASDVRIESALAARAAELLLRPPDSSEEYSFREEKKPQAAGRRETAPTGAEDEARAGDFSVLIIEDDPETCGLVTQTLADYKLEVVHDGVSGLARLISFKPDLVILDFDLPVIDGFRVLALIRASLNVPIIILSGSRMRAIDRVMASELGADSFLTKPFSATELKHKARQLIARYRGINAWIVTGAPAREPRSNAQDTGTEADLASEREHFVPYQEFEAEVEKRVKAAMAGGAPFSIVGCRLPGMTAAGGRVALRLFDMVRDLVRDADLISTNSRNDLVVLLADAGNSGARAFAGRLRERVLEALNQEPQLWMRSFPELAESTEADNPVSIDAVEGTPNRRASDPPFITNPNRPSSTGTL